MSGARKLEKLHVRVGFDILSHPKLIGAKADVKWLYVAGFVVAARERSDGHVRPAVVCAEAEVSASHVRTLVTRDLWHGPQHTCARCPQPTTGQYVIHDFLDWQRSRDEIEESSRRKSEAGRKGAASRWHGGKSHDTPHSSSHSTSHGTTMADTEPEPDIPVPTTSQSPTRPARDGLTDDDIDKIRRRLGSGCTTSHATQVATEILTRAEVTVVRPLRYVLAAIDAEFHRYRPTPGNPRPGDACTLPGHGSYPAQGCGACRSERIVAGD